MSIETVVPFRTLGFSDLFCDYVDGESRLRDRYPDDPFDADAGLRMADRLAKREYPRLDLIKRLVDYNQELGAGEATLRNIDLLKKPYSFVVCTGQQPGLLTGPLYTIYKALSCVLTARRYTERAREQGDPDRCFIPIFWCASEDHDLEEINHVFLPTDGDPRRIAAPLTNDGRTAEMVGVDKRIRQAYKDVISTLPKTDFKADILRMFEPRQNDTLGTWCNRILLSLFTDQGLVVLEPHLIRELGIPILRRELESWDKSSACLEKGAAALEKQGRPVAFDTSNRLHCFYIDGQRRSRLKTYADSVILGGSMIDRRELPFHLEEHPESFSPDASLRPIVQSSILPVVAYVAGPGEIAYYGQLKEFHAHFDVPMPIIVPRASVTIIEGAVTRGMAKFDLTHEALFGDPADHAAKIETPGKGEALGRDMDTLIEDSDKRLAAMADDVAELDPGTAKIVRKVAARVNKDLTYVRKRVTNAAEEAAGVGKRQLDRVFAQTFPRGRPQERVYNVLYYLVKYGTELTRGLLLHTPVDSRQHVLYTPQGVGQFVPVPVVIELAPPPNESASPAAAESASPAGSDAPQQKSDEGGEEAADTPK